MGQDFSDLNTLMERITKELHMKPLCCLRDSEPPPRPTSPVRGSGTKDGVPRSPYRDPAEKVPDGDEFSAASVRKVTEESQRIVRELLVSFYFNLMKRLIREACLTGAAACLYRNSDMSHIHHSIVEESKDLCQRGVVPGTGAGEFTKDIAKHVANMLDGLGFKTEIITDDSKGYKQTGLRVSW